MYLFFSLNFYEESECYRILDEPCDDSKLASSSLWRVREDLADFVAEYFDSKGVGYEAVEIPCAVFGPKRFMS